MTWHRKIPGQAACGKCCGIKEKLQTLWDRAIGCINKINDITPDGDGKFTIQGGQNVSITPISNGLAFDAVFPSGVLTINNQAPDQDGDISGIATTTQLTDGTVTKVGTANVGDDLKPIKLVAGVPTAVTNDLVDVSTAQTITVSKNFDADQFLRGAQGSVRDLCFIDKTNNVRCGMLRANPTTANNQILLTPFQPGSDTFSAANGLVLNNNGSDKYATVPYRAYNSANTNEIVTIGSLAANPSVVHTTGNEDINGSKRFVLPIRKVNANMTQGKPTSAFTSDLFSFQTSNGQVISELFMLYGTDGSVKLIGRNVNPDGTMGSSVTIATLRAAY